MFVTLLNKAISFQIPSPLEQNSAEEHLRGLTFVTVVYDDWHGMRNPIGVVHEMKMADGQKREIFTFCCKGPRQPELALFVKSRTGNSAGGLALCHEEMERIPTILKKLPNDYKDALLAGQTGVALTLVG